MNTPLTMDDVRHSHPSQSIAEQATEGQIATSDQSRRTALLVDGHVHFHACFALPEFLNAACRNFARARIATGLREPTAWCLLMTENASDHAFRDLRDGRAVVPGWSIETGNEGDAIEIVSEEGERLLLIAGRQIITSDNLEVLAIGLEGQIADGQDVLATLHTVRDHGAIPTLPWGFGKWTGRRGRIVREIIQRYMADESSQALLLGDNGNRLRMSARPAIFELAERAGIPVIPGSDPLPVPFHVHRVGTYGFLLEDWSNNDPPAQTIRSRLRALDQSPQTFGGLSSLPRFFRDQMLMQWRKRIGRA